MMDPTAQGTETAVSSRYTQGTERKSNTSENEGRYGLHIQDQDQSSEDVVYVVCYDNTTFAEDADALATARMQDTTVANNLLNPNDQSPQGIELAVSLGVKDAVTPAADSSGTSKTRIKAPVFVQSVLPDNISCRVLKPDTGVNSSLGFTKTTQSAVWEYFDRNVTINKTTCVRCKTILSGLNATNAKKHLKKCNFSLYERVLELDAPVKLKKPAQCQSGQTTLEESFEKKYKQNDTKQLAFRKALALFLGSNSVSNNLSQSSGFKDLVATLDKKIQVPSRPTINADIQQLLDEQIETIKESFLSVRQMTLSSDIWTKNGFTSSYIGVTSTFYHPMLQKKIQVVLGVQKFESVTHKSEDIIREMRKVVSRYNLKTNQVWRAMTDGGSNMICSHASINRMFESHTTDDADLDARFSEGFFIEDDILDYDSQMPSQTYRHLTCFVHTIITCLKLLEDDQIFENVINPVRLLVGKFNKSSILTQALVHQENTKLTSFIETRWNYIYHVLVKLRRVKAAVTEILVKNCKQKYLLSDSQWYQIDEIIAFIEPFNTHTNMSARERSIVSSEVVVTIITLYNHLDSYADHAFLSSLSARIKEKMKKKFSHWFHNNANNAFDGTFMVATLLDPRYRVIIPDQQKLLAKDFLLVNFKNEINGDDIEVNEPEICTPVPPKKSRFPIITAIRNDLQLNRQRENDKGSRRQRLLIELEKYLLNSTYDDLPESINIFDFWINRATEFPILSEIALDYLCVPDSTADVERVFSYGGILTHGRRNRLDGINLEREILLCKNSSVVSEMKQILSWKNKNYEGKGVVAELSKVTDV